MRLTTLSLAALLAATTSAKVITVQVGNPSAQVASEKLKFLPAVVRAEPGDTVRFQFNGNHSVTQQGDFNKCAPGGNNGVNPFDSGIRAKGDTFDLPQTLMVPGATINYYCKINNNAHCKEPNFMQGAVVVANAPAAAAAVPAAAGGAAGAAAGAAPGAAGNSTITVIVGKDGQNQFAPSTIEASAGDSVVFQWAGGEKTHNVVPSDKPQSCERSATADTDPTMIALASGAPQNSGQHVFKVPPTVKAGDVMNFFCSVGTHCTAGKMYGMIKIVPPGTAKNAVADGAAAAGGNAAGAAAGTAAGAAAGTAATAAADGDVETAGNLDAPPGTVRSGCASLAASSVAIVFPAAAAMFRLM